MTDTTSYKLKPLIHISSNGSEVQLVPFNIELLDSAKQIGVWELSNDIKIRAPYMFDGGGMQYKEFLIETIKKTGSPKYKRAFEWCAGFGVLGFECLSAELCEHVVFSDYHPNAIKFCLENASFNKIEGCVTGYVSPTISEIPSNEKWDLVVSNPPHSPSLEDTVSHIISEGQPIEAAFNSARLIVDSEWSIHKEFMKNIRPYLLPGADVYLIENNKHDFLIEWAGEAGLTYINTYSYPHLHVNEVRHVIMHFRKNIV